ncbi:hypothetical protein ABZP36_031928 [Zizania latifolia]
MASGRATTSSVVLVVAVAMAGLAAARPVGGVMAAGAAEEVDGMMGCMVGCFTRVLGCAFGCMGKGPDLPLCVVSCNQKSIVCMVRCAMTPSPPKPKPTPPPPTPTPKPPKPSPPKPPKPSPPKPKPSPPAPAPPPGPPYAGHSTQTFA